MKKILFLMVVLVLALGVYAAESSFGALIYKRVRGSGNVVEEQRQVSGFDKVHLSGVGNLKIELGEEEGLRIKAEDNLLPYLETYVRGTTLIIETEDNVDLDPTAPIYYYLTAKKLNAISVSGSGSVEAPQLEAEGFSVKVSGSADVQIDGLVTDSATIDISGKGDINMESVSAESIEVEIGGSGNVTIGNAKTHEQKVKVSGSGDIKIDSLTAESIEVNISGSGKVSIDNGKTDEQKIKISGTGDYTATSLESAQAEVDLSGSGSVALWVNDRLHADIGGSGSVKYLGTPTIDAAVRGSGKINHIDK